MVKVYAQAGGPYHKSKSCAGDSPYEFQLEEAENVGMEPCGNCVEKVSVEIVGYSSTTVTVSKDKWENMDDTDRQSWCIDMIQKHGTPDGVSQYETNTGEKRVW